MRRGAWACLVLRIAGRARAGAGAPHSLHSHIDVPTLCLPFSFPFAPQWVWGGVIFSFGFYFICLALICVSFAWTKLPPKKVGRATDVGSCNASCPAA